MSRLTPVQRKAMEAGADLVEIGVGDGPGFWVWRAKNAESAAFDTCEEAATDYLAAKKAEFLARRQSALDKMRAR